MTLTPEKLRELDRLASEATPGPWEHMNEFRGTAVFADQCRVTICRQTVAGGDDVKNAAFIAAANPTTVRALVAEIERLRGATPGTKEPTK